VCPVRVLTYQFIAFFVPSNADKLLTILFLMQIHFLCHVLLHTDRAEFVQKIAQLSNLSLPTGTVSYRAKHSIKVTSLQRELAIYLDYK
jgi:hypothetical protein